jgi:hypothetical protein
MMAWGVPKWEDVMADLVAGAVRALLTTCALGGFIGQAAAETFVEHSAETRMQLDLVVKDSALKAFLPDGWAPVVATQGAAKDCNVRMIFIDRIDVTKQDGSPQGSNQLVYLAVPIKQASSGNAGQMLIYGLTSDPKDAPGPFGVYAHAATHSVKRTTTIADGKAPMIEESWQFAAASGEHMEISLKYQRGVARKGGAPTKFFSATNPSFYQIFKIEQGLDIMRNATVNVPNHVQEFSYKGGGGKIAPLFDGTERVVSIDAFPWYNRGVFLP